MSGAMHRPWTLDATMRCLNEHPLPATVQWPHRDDGKDHAVRPSHGAVTGYGKWLRETPYFPGLFELVYELLKDAPDEFDAEWLPAELARVRAKFESEPARPGEHLAQKIRRVMPPANQPTLF